jgi:hypothetical protein
MFERFITLGFTDDLGVKQATGIKNSHKRYKSERFMDIRLMR